MSGCAAFGVQVKLFFFSFFFFPGGGWGPNDPHIHELYLFCQLHRKLLILIKIFIDFR